MNDHLKGLIVTTIGVLFIVPDSLFVRVIVADAMVVSFWRGLVSGSLIAIALLLFQGTSGFRAVFRTGWPGLIYAILIGSTTIGFVMAVTNTSVANVVFILAAMPIFSAIFSRIFLGEPFQVRMVVTMAFVLLGLGIIAYGSHSSEIASWKGDLWALYVTVAYAAGLTAVRKVKDVSMVPAIPFAFIGAALVLVPFVEPFEPAVLQWPLFTAHGAFIAAGSCLMTLGPRYISSTEVSLLILLESVLAPILVWMVIGEDPGNLALVGGIVVISALIISNVFALRAYRRKGLEPAP